MISLVIAICLFFIGVYKIKLSKKPKAKQNVKDQNDGQMVGLNYVVRVHDDHSNDQKVKRLRKGRLIKAKKDQLINPSQIGMDVQQTL